MKDKNNSRGVSIKRLNYIMAAITIMVSVLLLIVSYRTLTIYNSLTERTEVSVKGQKSAQDVEEASDYLTEQVRCFVESGERQYLDAYFEESDVTQRREKALEELGKLFKGTTVFTALEQAEKQSMNLMNTEFYAMRLTVDAYGYDLSSFPAAVQNVTLTDTDAALSNPEKKERARQLVFDDNYHLQKAIISAKTQECLNTIIIALENKQSDTANQFSFIIRVEQGLIIALIVIVLIIVLLTTFQVIAPLIKAIPHIQSDKPIPISGSEEFRYLASTYNKIYEENKSQKEELEFEASHDQLTGAFNRKGFEKILQGVGNTKTALLLIDVDRFKRINDTYGHAEGDKVLSKLTQVLSSHFHTGYALCRIGGDEFVLFLPDVGPEKKEEINQKVNEINNVLERCEDTPPTSISVGVAFGDNEDGIVVYKKADIALYRVKENGRRGCAFYE